VGADGRARRRGLLPVHGAGVRLPEVRPWGRCLLPVHGAGVRLPEVRPWGRRHLQQTPPHSRAQQ
jgi:hypothetical protein